MSPKGWENAALGIQSWLPVSGAVVGTWEHKDKLRTYPRTTEAKEKA